MKKNILNIVFVVFCLGGLAPFSRAETIINPSDDGALYTCPDCNPVNNGGYVLVAGYIQGIVIFPTAPITGSVSAAFLTVNPYGLPLFDPDVDVYGIPENRSTISAEDGNAGTYLGTLHLPNLGFGQDASFDVTAFMATNHTPYVGFNLRDGSGADVFSSMEYNYGHPSQLHVTMGAVVQPPTILCAAPLVLECENGSAVGTIQAAVLDPNGYPVQVVLTVDGTASQTNDLPSGGTVTSSNIAFIVNFAVGEHTVVVSASNGQSTPATCSATVTVSDTSPPHLSTIAAAPDLLWPPNHRMVPVSLTVAASDNCDPAPTARITKVVSNERHGHFGPDWTITGPLSVNLRADRLGNTDRIYTIYVQVSDSSGNSTTTTTTVTVSNHHGRTGNPPVKPSPLPSLARQAR